MPSTDSIPDPVLWLCYMIKYGLDEYSMFQVTNLMRFGFIYSCQDNPRHAHFNYQKLHLYLTPYGRDVLEGEHFRLIEADSFNGFPRLTELGEVCADQVHASREMSGLGDEMRQCSSHLG